MSSGPMVYDAEVSDTDIVTAAFHSFLGTSYNKTKDENEFWRAYRNDPVRLKAKA